MAEKINDIITLPEIKLVIELDDAERDSEGIWSSFVLTHEVEEGLKVVLNRVNEKKGCGVFIKGNFGCGKSHFLSYLYLLLKDKSPDLVLNYPAIGDTSFNLVKISLVKYPSSKSLEDIILDNFQYKQRQSNRTEEFKEIVNKPTVIIIDELSEFLRSKPTPSSFYEDIRFLQFMGEFSFHYPLWVIASLQEWIEETGHISSSIFNRIKDRYPIRLNLSSSHIEDIIDRRIIIKKEGADEIIGQVYAELKKYYPNLQVKYEDFRKTYPLHPFTVRYLSGLTQVFSQQRGVIHFVFNEAGKSLDSPPDMLITPDRIFDHFEERIREIPEFSVFARVVYDYYQTHINEIFTKQALYETALSLIKLMILTEISPLEKRKTARELAELSLKRISTFTSQINYDFIANAVLEPLAAHQMYIRKEQDNFFIDASIDEGIKIKGQIKKLRERFEDKNYLFAEICSLTMLPYLPLRDLSEGKKFRINWQNSLRDCVVMLSPVALIRADIDKMMQSLEKRLDSYLIILSPFAASDWIKGLKNTFSSQYLSSLIFWIPAPFTKEEIAFIEEFIAKNMLSREIDLIRNEIKRDEPAFREIITRIYFGGEIVYADGWRFENLKDIGLLPVERLLAHIIDYSLSKIYPEHYSIMPRTDYISTYNMNLLFYNFIRQGKISVEEAEKKGLISYIKGFLEPMGLVTKRGGNFLIALDVTNEIISHVLNLISHEESLPAVRLSLKKGKWGMTEEQINLLISAFIVTGHIAPLNKEEPVELRELQQLSTGEITKISRGRIISPELLQYIHAGRFIWGETEDTPTPLSQKTMWKEAVSFIRQKRKLIDDINAFISRYKDYTVFKKTSIDISILNRLSMLLSSMTLSLSPSEGIERVLGYLRQYPETEKDVGYLERLYKFFSEEFQSLNKYYIYITHPSFKLPKELEERRNNLLIKIEDLIKTLRDDFQEIKEGWEGFFELFISTYRDGHDAYYDLEIFKLKNKLEDDNEITTLKRIARIVTSVTFPWEWWQIKREIDKLPDRCSADIDHELFSYPVCRCGYKIGDTPPALETDFSNIGRLGLVNFIKTLQLPENREKLDSFTMGAADAGLQEIAKKIHIIINLKVEKTDYSLLPALFTVEVMDAIEKAFKGRWKVKELNTGEFLDKIRGRRFRYGELKGILLNWIGDEEEAIIHVLDSSGFGESIMRDEFAKYGIQGERVYIDLSGGAAHCKKIEDLEDKLKDTQLLHHLDTINMSSYQTDELLDFLKKEKLGYLRKMIRHEIFFRLKDKAITKEFINDIDDEVLKDIAEILKIVSSGERFRGVEIFTNVIAPAEYLIGKLLYKSQSRDVIDKAVIEYLESNLANITAKYEKDKSKYEGARDINYISNTIKGIVIILDGLRYDLWFMMRGMMEKEGWKIAEEALMIPVPSTTENFRKALGMEDSHSINGKGFHLYKFAEKNIGKREIRKFLKGEEDIKFLHFNFIDTKIHNSVLDLYPLYAIIGEEFKEGILPLLKEAGTFYLVSDHGFSDTGNLKDRYIHGKGSTWEIILPFVKCS